MNDQPNIRAGAPEFRSNAAVISALLMVCLMAYAFAAGGWHLAGEPPGESVLATSWQNFSMPSSHGEIDLAKRQ